MRDTIILGIAFVALTFGLYQYRKSAGSVPSFQTTALNQKQKGSWLTRKKGNRNERTSIESNLSTETATEGEGASGENTEVANLPSIYSKSSTAEQSKPRIAKKRKGRSAIGGFDTDSYVMSAKNSLRHGPVTPETEAGLRVFLMCMEVKRGQMESQSVADCRALYSENIAARFQGKNSEF